MRKLTILTIIAASAVFSAACAGANSNTAAVPTSNTAANANQTATNSNHGSNAAATGGDETPAAVKAAFPAAQSFTVQHKDISESNQTQIEKDAGAKVPDKDHHSYLAFSTAGGTRKQIGAATVVKANGKEIVVIYENKDGMPTIKEVRAENVPAAFLQQFVGKGHDNEMVVGSDIKLSGADETVARAITEAVRVDAVTMQTLYGKAHTH